MAEVTAGRLRDLGVYVSPHKRALALGAVLALGASVAGLAQPLAARSVIDALTDGRSALGPVLVLTALVVVSAVLVGAYLWVLERTAERVVLGARLGLVARILRLKVAEIDRQRPGDLVARVTSDSTLLRAAATSSIVQVTSGSVTLVGALVLMGLLDWVLFLVTLGVLALVAVVVFVIVPRIGAATRRAQEAVGTVGSALDRALGAIKTVKASGAEGREIAEVAGAANVAYREGVRVARHMAEVGVTSSLALQVAFLAVLGVGGARVADGALDIGTLVAFLLYLFYLTDPISSLTQAATQLHQGAAAAGRIGEALALEVEDPGEPSPARPAAAGDLVVFEDVSFRYLPEGPDVLRDVSFAVPRRGQVAVVGPSGAGKTTLFSLLERFYEPRSGTILLDGEDLSGLALADVRSRIGYVEQEAPVLAGTLRENVAYATPDASDEQILAVLAETRLDEFLAGLPDGLDTRIGTRGTTLSGGQRQRIAIARALLRRPELLLLDEATAQLDAVNELALREVVERAAERRAVLVIAHRLSTVVAADRIVLLEGGRVRAIGSHDELVEDDELYRELAATQLLTK